MRCLHRRAPHVRIFPIVKASPSIDVWEKNHIASTFPIGELAPRMDFAQLNSPFILWIKKTLMISDDEISSMYLNDLKPPASMPI